MNNQNQNTFKSFSNNQNPNNQAMNNQAYNQSNNQAMNNQGSANQSLSNQVKLQNESSLAALGYNPQQDLEIAAELNQKTPGEISRILASQSMTGIEFGYLPNAAQMNNMNNSNNMNSMNNMSNPNNLNNANANNQKY